MQKRVINGFRSRPLLGFSQLLLFAFEFFFFLALLFQFLLSAA